MRNHHAIYFLYNPEFSQLSTRHRQ